MQFILITRPDLTDTNTLFEAACAARGLSLVKMIAGQAHAANLGASGARLIYCAATDWSSRLVEKLLARPGDALLHDPHFICDHQAVRLARAGIPMAKAVYVPDEQTLEDQAAWLGGFPVVVKRPGTEGGTGVSLATDIDDLRTQLSAEGGFGAMIEAFVPHHQCWRLTVLGDRLLAASASAPPDKDFRSNVSGGRIVENASLPDGAARIAIDAVHALRLTFGGVDLMEGPDGELTLAEVNFPCYFADQQDRLGADIAGAIVDQLLSIASSDVPRTP